MHESPVIYCYDGSFNGFLCGVFESFLCHELPFDLRPPQRDEPTLYPLREIVTDAAMAQRVLRSFRPKLGAKAEQMIMRDFLSGREDKEILLLRFLHFAYDIGPGAIQMMGHPDVAPMYEMARSLDWEVDKFQGFVRFEENDGMLGAVIHPKNHILPLIQGHFCARLPEENFVIYDATHSEALLYKEHHAELLVLDSPLALPPPDKKEAEYQQLWKRFYDTLAIESRRNERCRQTHCPKRFWSDLTELRDEV